MKISSAAALAALAALTAILPAISYTAVNRKSFDESLQERQSRVIDERGNRALTELRDSAASLLRTLPSPGSMPKAGRLLPYSKDLGQPARERDLAALKPVIPVTMASRGEPPDMDSIDSFRQLVEQAEAIERHADILSSACAAGLARISECLLGKLELAAARRPAPELGWRNFKAIRRGGQWVVLPASGGELKIPWNWRLKSATPQGLVFEKPRSPESANVIQIADAGMGSLSFSDALGRSIDPDTGTFASLEKDFLTPLSREEPLRGWPVN